VGRRILIAGQNETVRKHQGDDVDLATIGLLGCVAVIFKDKAGNASLTHVDSETDLDFILDEAKLMNGDFTIDIVMPNPAQGFLYAKVRNAIERHGLGDVKNSKGTLDIRKTSKGTVLMRGDTLLIPEPKDIFEIVFHQPLSDGNKLKGDEVEHGYGDMQLRIYTRQLNMVFSETACCKPIVIFDKSKWIDKQEKLDEKVKGFLDTIKSDDEKELISRCVKHKRMTPSYLKSALYVIPRYKNYINELSRKSESKKSL